MSFQSIFSCLIILFFTACAHPKEPSHNFSWEMEFLADDMYTKNGERISLHSNKHSIPIDTFRDYEKKIYAVAVSADEKYLAVGGHIEGDSLNNSYISLYHYNESKPFKTLMSHSDTVNDLAFSSDSQYLVSASEDNSVKIWSIKDLALKQTISFHENSVYGVQMVKDGSSYKVLSVGADKQIALHTFNETTNSVTLNKKHLHVYKLKYISYDKIKKEFAVCGEAKEVAIYDLALNHIKTISTEMIPHRLWYGRNRTALIVGGGKYSSRITIYKTSDYTLYYK